MAPRDRLRRRRLHGGRLGGGCLGLTLLTPEFRSGVPLGHRFGLGGGPRVGKSSVWVNQMIPPDIQGIAVPQEGGEVEPGCVRTLVERFDIEFYCEANFTDFRQLVKAISRL